MTTPYDHFFWQLREMQRALDLLSPQLLSAYNALPKAIEDQVAQLRMLEERFTLPTAYLDAIDRLQNDLLKNPALDSLALITARQSAFIEEIQASQSNIALLTKQSFELSELAARPAIRVREALIPIEALLSSTQLSDAALGAMLLPYSAYQTFAESQIGLAASAASKIATANRLLFADAAGELLEQMSKASELAVLMTKGISKSEFPAAWEVNLYAGLATRAEAVDFEDESFKAEEFVEGGCETGVARIGQRLVRLVYDLNTEAEREGRPPVFKPTTKSQYACMFIATRVATEDDSFYAIVDQLYFILYEGSADAQRLTATWGTDRLEALWLLKHLRRGARHDLAHGRDREIEQKIESVAEAFKKLIGAVIPKARADWCRAQLALYTQLVEMLEHLWFSEARVV
jgi:hypothetical protein